ncbi:MAG: PAS domain-containing protein [Candidatus Andersenbacteria bacterium]
MVNTAQNAGKEGAGSLDALRFACAQHLDKHRRTLVLEWVKQLRARLNLPTASNLPDPAFTALTYRALDLTFRKLVAALRDNRLHDVVTDFAANHHEVLDHERSLLPLLTKLDTLGMLIRRSLIADPTIPAIPALYYFDRVFSTLQVECALLFGERRRNAFRQLTSQYTQEIQAVRSVVGSCPVGILVTDRQGYITHFNGIQQKISGKSAEQVIGKRLYYDYAYRQADEFRQAFMRAIQVGETAHFARRRYESSNGLQYLDVTLAPVKDEHGRITGVVQMLEDVTARVDLEEQLRAQNRDLTTRLKELEEAYEYIGRVNRQFASLVDINTTLSSRLSLDKMLDFIVRSAAMLTRARLTTLRLLDGEQLKLAAQFGLDGSATKKYVNVPVDGSIIGKVLRENRRLLIVNLVHDTDFYWPELRKGLNLQQLCAVALRSRGKTIGVLSIHLREQREFSMHEQNFLLALANHAALAIDLEKTLSTVRRERGRGTRPVVKQVPKPTSPIPLGPSPVVVPPALPSTAYDPIRYSR